MVTQARMPIFYRCSKQAALGPFRLDYRLLLSVAQEVTLKER